MTGEEKELNEMLDRIEKQHDILRKLNGEEAEYKHLEKKDTIKVSTNDKQAMKFWEEQRKIFLRQPKSPPEPDDKYIELIQTKIDK